MAVLGESSRFWARVYRPALSFCSGLTSAVRAPAVVMNLINRANSRIDFGFAVFLSREFIGSFGGSGRRAARARPLPPRGNLRFGL